jgi:hypothetical protein
MCTTGNAGRHGSHLEGSLSYQRPAILAVPREGARTF